MSALAAATSRPDPLRPGGDARPPPGPRWHVVWTRSNCEELVRQQLAGNGFEVFLPTLEVWSRRRGPRRRVSVPMFSSYLFLRDHLDKQRHVQVLGTRGLVRVLGEGWDRPAVVPESEIEAIRRVVEGRTPAFAHPYLKAGRRVRIVRGSLAGVEGILARAQPEKGVVVLSVSMLRSSVAVHVDCTDIVSI
jgi:transcription antitermination factor NusG